MSITHTESTALNARVAERAEVRLLVPAKMYDDVLETSGIGRQSGIVGFERYLETKTIGCL